MITKLNKRKMEALEYHGIEVYPSNLEKKLNSVNIYDDMDDAFDLILDMNEGESRLRTITETLFHWLSDDDKKDFLEHEYGIVHIKHESESKSFFYEIV